MSVHRPGDGLDLHRREWEITAVKAKRKVSHPRKTGKAKMPMVAIEPKPAAVRFDKKAGTATTDQPISSGAIKTLLAEFP